MEGLCTIIAGTGSGPEGSRPTAGNYRLQVYGEEKASGLTGMQARWQPAARLPFIFNYIGLAFRSSPRTTGKGITPRGIGGLDAWAKSELDTPNSYGC